MTLLSIITLSWWNMITRLKESYISVTNNTTFAIATNIYLLRIGLNESSWLACWKLESHMLSMEISYTAFLQLCYSNDYQTGRAEGHQGHTSVPRSIASKDSWWSVIMTSRASALQYLSSFPLSRSCLRFSNTRLIWLLKKDRKSERPISSWTS